MDEFPYQNAPRVTPEIIRAKIVDKTVLRHGLLTICILKLENGFTVTGESACVSEANYDADIGERIAEENAFEKIWPLEGYLLAQRLYEESKHG